MSLVQELKKEHAAIASALEKASKLGIGTKEGQLELFRAKTLLLNHLKKEDDKLYPSLRSAAKNNDHLKRTLKSFADDMDKISEAALGFFDKYTDGGSGIEFARDFGGLYSKLSMRIRKEETILYDLFDSLDSNNKHKEAG